MLKEIFKRLNVIVDGHFVLVSGKHTDKYFNKDAIYAYPKETSTICLALAQGFFTNKIEVVLAPALGGICLSQWIAYHLSLMTGREVLAVYAEKKDEKNFVIRRSYNKLIPGKNILVAGDVITDNGTTGKVIELARSLEGNVVGLGVIFNRGGLTRKDIGVPKFRALFEEKMNTWGEIECIKSGPCSNGIPINLELGYGRQCQSP